VLVSPSLSRPVPRTEEDLELLLDYLKRTRGFDFTGYKRASLERRIIKRMDSVGVDGFDAYVDYLEVHPDEFLALFNTVLINVTAFFRDPGTWSFLAESVIPDLVTRRAGLGPIRVWSAGCASGEEAYTLAILFCEALGVDGFRDSVKIYATDVDEEALAKARQASYSEREVADVPEPLLAKYFEKIEDRFVFRKDLRRHVIFGRHDLIQDAPISRVDMLVCRNALMYFNAETQARILARFQFALNPHGVLFLGRAETLLTHAAAFTPLDVKRRISTRLPVPARNRERVAPPPQQPTPDSADAPSDERLRSAALDAVTTAQLLVDHAGVLVFANERARQLFSIPRSDEGRPLQDLRISYRPVELRSAIDKVLADVRPVILRDVEWVSGTDTRWFEVHLAPLGDGMQSELGVSIGFHDVTVAKRLQSDLEHANAELETAYEELQSTNEELETTNEELQSTVEELETTNEELQSTNEELETMNEELQSTNEELQTMNDEIRLRSDELNHVNGFLESVLGSLRGAVVVVQHDLTVLAWNAGAAELWGLREEETRGKNILALDMGLPIEQLKQPIRACLTGAELNFSTALDAVNRRGRSIRCVVSISPLTSAAQEIVGAILVMETEAMPREGDGIEPITRKPKHVEHPH
jgi:two-component system CheB/CheR fusion protein